MTRKLVLIRRLICRLICRFQAQIAAYVKTGTILL